MNNLDLSNTVLAWHFTAEADKFHGGRKIPPLGVWVYYPGPVQICTSGLHASVLPLDALKYAPGNICHRVECAGIEAAHSDKFVCRARRIISFSDASAALRVFARRVAMDVIHLWDAPTAVREYLDSGDETLRVAAAYASASYAAAASYAAYAAYASASAAASAAYAASASSAAASYAAAAASAYAYAASAAASYAYAASASAIAKHNNWLSSGLAESNESRCSANR